MYVYDSIDKSLLNQRVAEFREQVRRRLAGELTEDQFKPLRLMNGLYLQLHAYMLRVAIPYGTLSSDQMRKLAYIARKYDRGYGHFTTRQNIQYNWLALSTTPDLLYDLSEVDLHAIQTSGNCIRNVTADPYAGAADDEVDDPRIWSEVIRQWSTFHPEFSYLPRKFKIAVTGADADRAAIKFHDIGLRVVRNSEEELGFQVFVGGGQGRTPIVAPLIRPFLPYKDLLRYLDAVLRVYNRFGRRDNIYKARIKILVQSLGAQEFSALVEDEFQSVDTNLFPVSEAEVSRIRAMFESHTPRAKHDGDSIFAQMKSESLSFRRWCETNVHDHKIPGYAIATISLKPIGGIPGDASADQMDAIADLADRFGSSEIRVTYTQNLVFPHVQQADLYALWQELGPLGLATSNIGLVTDIIACPGLDYCSLANARSIPIAQAVSDRFSDLDEQHNIGPLDIRISGCINACGHHHAGHIGILGVDKKGEELYQLTLGGQGDGDSAVGKILGPGFDEIGIVDAVENVIATYLSARKDNETFAQTHARMGPAPFKERLYGAS
ncbi:MAG: nitrite/sulfite reductase [Rhodospirillaceae bacterium]